MRTIRQILFFVTALTSLAESCFSSASQKLKFLELHQESADAVSVIISKEHLPLHAKGLREETEGWVYADDFGKQRCLSGKINAPSRSYLQCVQFLKNDYPQNTFRIIVEAEDLPRGEIVKKIYEELWQCRLLDVVSCSIGKKYAFRSLSTVSMDYLGDFLKAFVAKRLMPLSIARHTYSEIYWAREAFLNTTPQPLKAFGWCVTEDFSEKKLGGWFKRIGTIFPLTRSHNNVHFISYYKFINDTYGATVHTNTDCEMPSTRLKQAGFEIIYSKYYSTHNYCQSRERLDSKGVVSKFLKIFADASIIEKDVEEFVTEQLHQ